MIQIYGSLIAEINMISVIQRVKRASVSVDGSIISSINKGLLVLAGIEKGDTSADLEYSAKKITELRILDRKSVV